ncbi:MAG: hypothetical protein PHD31_02310 [Candidatus Pacebacteria bacterium]|nr:hypothetical protein [Candidatus Paceibacterota bacterium]
MKKELKKCCFCAEDILVDAKVCKHCGRNVFEAEKLWYEKNISLTGIFISIISLISFFAGFGFWPAWILFVLCMIYFSTRSKNT